jgi:hypothetical protein
LHVFRKIAFHRGGLFDANQANGSEAAILEKTL